MRDTIKGCVIGALVAAGMSVLLAQSATWTTPRTWATADLLTASDFNSQFRDNLLWLRQDAQLTGTAALLDLGCGTLGTNEVLFSDCSWATIPAGVVFDLHDDVGTAATIVDSDRMVFSDEGSAGDPMRFSTAANIADYMQAEVELSANRVTSDVFAVARIPDLPAANLTSTNDPADGQVPSYDVGTGGFSWVDPFDGIERVFYGAENNSCTGSGGNCTVIVVLDFDAPVEANDVLRWFAYSGSWSGGLCRTGGYIRDDILIQQDDDGDGSFTTVATITGSGNTMPQNNGGQVEHGMLTMTSDNTTVRAYVRNQARRGTCSQIAGRVGLTVVLERQTS